MPEGNVHIDYDLIAKYLAGEATPEETQEIRSWLNYSEENRQSFARLQSLWEKTGRIEAHDDADVNVDDAWAKFTDRISTLKPDQAAEKPPGKTRNLFYYASRIAAVLVIGLGFYWMYTLSTSTPEEAIVLSATTQPVSDTLSDGSVVTLNQHSQLSFASTFGEEKRGVSLQGEAFFEVTSDPATPFEVGVEGATVTVLGTSFYVSAYDSLAEITVGVEEGRVQVRPDDSEELVILEKGQRISIERLSKEITRETYEPNDVYWKSKTLIFQNDPLSEVFATLEKSYNINIRVENPQILTCRLTAKFSDEDIARIFEIISTNFNLTPQYDANQFTVSGSGCE